jgi:hypothetical protein
VFGVSWIRLAIYAAAIAAVVVLWTTWLSAHDAGVATAATNAERNAWLERDRQELERAAAETERRHQALKESNREARRFIEQAAAADAADRGSRQRLHDAQAAATAARRGLDPAAVERCAPAEAAVDLHAELSRRIDEAAGELARFAEAAHGAGLTCEREHDALTGARP